MTAMREELIMTRSSGNGDFNPTRPLLMAVGNEGKHSGPLLPDLQHLTSISA